ncbi:MAG: NUDIX hydrolase [Patescibacteria group bacterium]
MDFNGVKAAVFHNNQLLVYLRDDKPGLRFANMWDFPGGGREGEETVFETLQRETQEEFGISITPEMVFWQKAYPAMHDHNLQAFACGVEIPAELAESIVFGDEGQRWQWMSVEEVLSRDDVVPFLKHRLSDCLKERNGE